MNLSLLIRIPCRIKIRELGITQDGELRIKYLGRTEKVQSINEQAITNAFQRLMRSGERWVVFLEGHGERRAQGTCQSRYGRVGLSS